MVPEGYLTRNSNRIPNQISSLTVKELVERAVVLVFGLAIATGLAEIFIRVAASIRSDVKYLATAGVDKIPRVHASFEDFLGEFKGRLIPHGIHRNYYSNSLGFTDREFSIEKPKGRGALWASGTPSSSVWCPIRRTF
jgi:hypothetical protein